MRVVDGDARYLFRMGSVLSDCYVSGCFLPSAGETLREREQPYRHLEDSINSQMNERIMKIAREENDIIKMLLLGASESGKSTIMRQMVLNYSHGYSQMELSRYVPVIHRNICEAMQVFLRACALWGKEDKSFALPERYHENVRLLLKAKISGVIRMTSELSRSIMLLWGTPQVKNVYQLRSNLHISDGCEYFFNDLKRVLSEKYTPTIEDMLHSREKTRSVVEKEFVINGGIFKVIDVGGQRNQRKKWIECFHEVNSIIFVVNLSGYDETLDEDNSRNKMHEALDLFEEICKMQAFVHTPIILLLNKLDLFSRKILNVPLSNCFVELDEKRSDSDIVQSSLQTIVHKFESRAHGKLKGLHIHFTQGTSRNIMKKVLMDIKLSLLMKYMQQSGMDEVSESSGYY